MVLSPWQCAGHDHNHDPHQHHDYDGDDDMKYLNRCVWNGPDNTLDSISDEGDGVGQVRQDDPSHDGDPQLCSVPDEDGEDDENGDDGHGDDNDDGVAIVKRNRALVKSDKTTPAMIETHSLAPYLIKMGMMMTMGMMMMVMIMMMGL